MTTTQRANAKAKYGEPWGYARTHPNSLDFWYVLIDREGRGPILDVGGQDYPGQIGEAKHGAFARGCRGDAPPASSLA